ncbi:sulfatase-like hydrolase/transferase, partial [Myxococcota bacterium]|nr:sulfatase-like hydrolase/transferase [Myxococcota bacterium]
MNSFSKKILSGLGYGALLGLLYFVADLTGAFLAIGWLFVPSIGGFFLLALALLVATSTSALLGAVLSLLPTQLWLLFAKLRLPPLTPRTSGISLIAIFMLAIGVSGFVLRAERKLPDPGPRPELSATNPTPILWIVADTLRADALYGEDQSYPHAPELKKFATKSHVFTQAESTAAWTIPSMAAMLTGVHNTTMDASAGHLPNWVPTIAEHLRASGYSTHAIVDNVLLEPRSGYADGFESFFARSTYRFAFSLPSFRLLSYKFHHELRGLTRSSYLGAPGLSDEAIRVVNESS